MDMNKEDQDIMSAEQILDELKKLSESERSENASGSQADANLIDEAIAALEKFVSAEKDEEPTVQSEVAPASTNGVVDTSVLTGPIGGLKNFLMKNQRDNEVK